MSRKKKIVIILLLVLSPYCGPAKSDDGSRDRNDPPCTNCKCVDWTWGGCKVWAPE